MTQLPLLIVFGAALMVGLYATLHRSLRELSRGKLQRVADRNGGMSRLEPILDQIHEHALAMALLRTTFSVVLLLATLIEFTGGVGAALSLKPLVLAGFFSAAALYLAGAVIPSSIANHSAEAVVHRCASLIRITHLLVTPIVRGLRFIDVIVGRLAGANLISEQDELEQELLAAVSESEHEGRIDEGEREMIEAVVEFRSTTIDGIMTPRTEMEGIELTDDLRAVKSFIEQAGHSRIPVYEDDLDHIVGVLYAKDLLSFLGRDMGEFKLRPMLREPHFVPETKHLRALLRQFQQEKVHMAIVLDEYGGTAGLVTIEDVIEEIVGEITDEYEPPDEAPPNINVLSDQRAVEVDARAYIDDVNDELEKIGEQLPEREDYDTVGGFVLATLGRIPEAGDSFTRNGHVVKVLDAEPTRVTRVRIEFTKSEDDVSPQQTNDA